MLLEVVSVSAVLCDRGCMVELKHKMRGLTEGNESLRETPHKSEVIGAASYNTLKGGGGLDQG